MTTTASSTPGLKRRRTERRALLAAALTAFLAGSLRPGLASAEAVELSQLRLERGDDGVYLSAVVQFEMPPGVEDVLDKGIAVYFVAEAELYRERWYWTDRKIAHAARYMRLSFQPLTRRWRVNSSPLPLNSAGAAVALAQNFDSMDEALAAIKGVARLRLTGDAADIADEPEYPVVFRFRLDNSQLPRPFQIGVVGQADWNLSIERSVRLPVEKLR